MPAPLSLLPRPSVPDESPFETAQRRGVPMRVGPKHLLRALSHYLEDEAMAQPGAPVVLAAFQDASRFTPAIARRYARLAQRCSLVGALATGLPVEPAPGLRGAVLGGRDRLRDQWTVTVVSPGFAGAQIARDLGDTGPEDERRFEFVLTHDRDLVLLAAEALMLRLLAMEH